MIGMKFIKYFLLLLLKLILYFYYLYLYLYFLWNTRIIHQHTTSKYITFIRAYLQIVTRTISSVIIIDFRYKHFFCNKTHFITKKISFDIFY